jgi:CRP-like cAMP-binding protein
MAKNTPAIVDILDILTDCKMFDHMQSELLRGASPYFGINNYTAGETIFKEGDKGDFMCIVQKGSVSVVKNDNDGNPVVMGTEGVGHVFGEMAVLDNEPRSASCVAETNCELLTLAKTALDTLLNEKPRIGAEILRAIAISLSHRMRFSAGRLVDYLE